MLLKILINWLKKLMLLIQTKSRKQIKSWKKKIEAVDKEIPDTNKFIVAQYFFRLEK